MPPRMGFRETPGSALWYDGVAKHPDTGEEIELAETSAAAAASADKLA